MVGDILSALGFLEAHFGLVGVALGGWVGGLIVFYYRFRLPQKDDLTSGHIDLNEVDADYRALRERVSGGGPLGAVYAVLVQAALNKVDRFFHDDPATEPTWTSASMDRALGLAVAYPLMSMFAVYWFTGLTGPAEQALGLSADLSAAARALQAISLIVVFLSINWLNRPLPAQRGFIFGLLRFSAVVVAVVVAVFVSDAVAGAGAFAFAFALAVAVTGAFAVAFAFAFTVVFAVIVAVAGASAVSAVFVFAGAGAGAFAVVGAVAAAFVLLVQRLNGVRPGLGWGLFFPVFLLAPLVVILLLPLIITLEDPLQWTLLLMLVGLPLINALFDWVSLGLTRRLLRSGLRQGGYWPFINASIDVVAAIVLLFALLVASLAYIHGLNLAASSVGAPPLLDVSSTLFLLRTDAANPSLWWIYVTVFTTFIPSLVNLCLGGLAIVRGVPGLGGWIVEQFLPIDPRGLTTHRRAMASLLLTAQLTAALFGAVFIGWIAFTLVFTGLEHIGFGLVSVAEGVNGGLSALFPV